MDTVENIGLRTCKYLSAVSVQMMCIDPDNGGIILANGMLGSLVLL